MKAYRIYILTPEDFVARSTENQFASDHEAMSRAEALRHHSYAVEVWRGSCLIGRVGGEFQVAC